MLLMISLMINYYKAASIEAVCTCFRFIR